MSKHEKECLVQLTSKCWGFMRLSGGPLLFSYILSLSGLNYFLQSKYYLYINDFKIYIFKPESPLRVRLL